jgi:hypothetical protein
MEAGYKMNLPLQPFFALLKRLRFLLVLPDIGGGELFV